MLCRVNEWRSKTEPLKLNITGPHIIRVPVCVKSCCSIPQMYNFTHFAMSLNELEPGMEAILAPTDCRFRPDIRAMENGNMSKSFKKKKKDFFSFILLDRGLFCGGTSPCPWSHLRPLMLIHFELSVLPPAGCLRSLLTWFYFAFVDDASTEKERLEEKQRAARKERAKNEWSTRWDHMQQHECTNGAHLLL